MNPSRCAILSSDQWATVSPSYKQELLDTSPLTSILKNHPQPFAFPNGIPKEIRLKKLMDVCGNDHFKAKEILQKKYFGAEKLDDSRAIYAFVGRITQQKGVHLILEAAEQLIKKSEGRVQVNFIVIN
jgi:glycogen synthase